MKAEFQILQFCIPPSQQVAIFVVDQQSVVLVAIETRIWLLELYAMTVFSGFAPPGESVALCRTVVMH